MADARIGRRADQVGFEPPELRAGGEAAPEQRWSRGPEREEGNRGIGVSPSEREPGRSAADPEQLDSTEPLGQTRAQGAAPPEEGPGHPRGEPPVTSRRGLDAPRVGVGLGHDDRPPGPSQPDHLPEERTDPGFLSDEPGVH